MDKNITPESIEGEQMEEYVAVIQPDKTIKLVPLDDYNKLSGITN